MTTFHRVLIVIGILMLLIAPTFAQTPEPPIVPDVEIPVEDSIGYLNTWIAIFAPIFLFIGMIPVALGLLRYITRLFTQAFGGSTR
jgi:peptidoglycan biosynthesis protein MviN/MurJ (putative lipid II flippase)